MYFSFYAVHRYGQINWFPHGHVYGVEITDNLSEYRPIISQHLNDRWNDCFMMDSSDPAWNVMKTNPLFENNKFVVFEPVTTQERNNVGECCLRERVCALLFHEIQSITNNQLQTITLTKGPGRELSEAWSRNKHVMNFLCMQNKTDIVNSVSKSVERLIKDDEDNVNRQPSDDPEDVVDVLVMELIDNKLIITHDHDAGDNFSAE